MLNNSNYYLVAQSGQKFIKDDYGRPTVVNMTRLEKIKYKLYFPKLINFFKRKETVIVEYEDLFCLNKSLESTTL